ncbi:MAG: hypothetical protein WCN92_02885 [Eubacteriales bacterium]
MNKPTFEHDSETASNAIQFGITPEPELTEDEKEQLYSEEIATLKMQLDFIKEVGVNTKTNSKCTERTWYC